MLFAGREVCNGKNIARGLEYVRTLTLKMASALVVEKSAANNSPSQDFSHPDDHFQSKKKKG